MMLTKADFTVYKRVGLLIVCVAILLFFGYIIGSMVALPAYGFLTLEAVLGLCVAFLIYRWPSIGFGLMIFLVPFGPVVNLGERSIPLFLGVLLLGIYGSRVLILHENIRLDRVTKIICAFVLWGFVTSLWAYDSLVSIVSAIRLTQMIILYILVFNYCRTQRQLDIITLSYAAGALFASVVSVFKGVTYGARSTRVSLGAGFNPNWFSAILGPAMVLTFYYIYNLRNKLLKIMLIIGILFASYSVIRAQTRGVWIAIPVSLLTSLILVGRNSKLIKRAIIIILILIGGVISAYYSGIINKDIVDRFETLFSGDPYKTTAGRNYIWRVGLEEIKHNPLLGVGLNNFSIAYVRYAKDINIFFKPHGEDAHNTFIAVLADTGVIGFFIFMGIVVYLFKGIWRITEPITRLTYLWLFTCFIIINLVGNQVYSSFFWVIILLIALRIRIDRQVNHVFLSK